MKLSKEIISDSDYDAKRPEAFFVSDPFDWDINTEIIGNRFLNNRSF